MLAALLLSSTAVYADTIEVGTIPTQEVVELKTENEEPKADESKEGESEGEEPKVDEHKEGDSEGEVPKEDEHKEGESEGDVPGEVVKEPCEHVWEDRCEYVDNNTHKVYKQCTKCGEIKDENIEDCDISEYKINENSHNCIESGKHIEYASCKKCEHVFEKVTDCTIPEYKITEKSAENTQQGKHIKYATCECGKEYEKIEDCEMKPVDGQPGVMRCEECGYEEDTRDTEPKITVSYESLDGTPIESLDDITNNGFSYKVFNNGIKLLVTVDCQFFNDKKVDKWNKLMDTELYLNSASGPQVIQLKLNKNSSVENGKAVYEYEIKEPTDEAITVVGATAQYKYYEERHFLFFTYYKKIEKSMSKDIGYILRNANPQEHLTEYSQKVWNDEWTEGEGQFPEWYSRNCHNQKDLTITLNSVTSNELTEDSVVLEDQYGKQLKCVPVSNIVFNGGSCNDLSREGFFDEDKFSCDTYIYYENELNYNVPTDVKDDEYKYTLTDTNIKDPVVVKIDNTKPVLNFERAVSGSNYKPYYNDTVTIKATLTELTPNSEGNNLTIKTSEQVDEALSDLHFDFKDTDKADVQYVEIPCDKNGKYEITGTYTDRAGNTYSTSEDNQNDLEAFIVDKIAPVLKVTFDNHDVKHEKYYKADRTATLVLTDKNIDGHEADINKVTISSKTGKPVLNQMTGENGEYKGSIVFNEDGVYTLSKFDFIDKAGNPCVIEKSDQDYNKEFVIDKTAPVITVDFDNNSYQNGNYFKDARVATIKFAEVNFAKDQVSIRKNSGEEDSVPGFSAYEDSEKTHITKINFDKDGRYGFTLSCEDLAGNISNTYESPDFIIDKTAPELEITGVSDMSANNGKVVPVIKSKDKNLTDACTEITLTGSNNGIIKPEMVKTSGTEMFTYEIADLAHEKANDDLYTLNVKLTDLAGNKVEKTYKYSLNRFGSIFVLSDATKSMVNNYYVTKPQDVVITEINVDSLASKEVSVAYDGNVKNVAEGRGYQVSDHTNNKGWHSISYTVDASNFNKDGMYSVTVFSEDRATNKQSNQSKDAEVAFLMDATAPSIVVSGLEDEGVYEEASHDFSINAVDTIGVADMKVLLNGDEIGAYSAKELADNGGTVVLTVPSKDDYQKVEIICSDIAGNKTNLAYNNILVSEKAEELLVSENLTPTTGDKAETSKVETNITNNLTKIIGVLALILALIMIAVVVIRTSMKKNRK